VPLSQDSRTGRTVPRISDVRCQIRSTKLEARNKFQIQKLKSRLLWVVGWELAYVDYAMVPSVVQVIGFRIFPILCLRFPSCFGFRASCLRTIQLVGGELAAPASIDFVILSHAHIDHSGRLPALVAQGYLVIIPALAVGRTQEILARLNDLIESRKLEQCPVYVDSPMAVAATKVFAVHPEAYSEAARKELNAGDQPLAFPGLRLVTSVEESIELNHSKEACVIISAAL